MSRAMESGTCYDGITSHKATRYLITLACQSERTFKNDFIQAGIGLSAASRSNSKDLLQCTLGQAQSPSLTFPLVLTAFSTICCFL